MENKDEKESVKIYRKKEDIINSSKPNSLEPESYESLKKILKKELKKEIKREIHIDISVLNKEKEKKLKDSLNKQENTNTENTNKEKTKENKKRASMFFLSLFFLFSLMMLMAFLNSTKEEKLKNNEFDSYIVSILNNENNERSIRFNIEDQDLYFDFKLGPDSDLDTNSKGSSKNKIVLNRKGDNYFLCLKNRKNNGVKSCFFAQGETREKIKSLGIKRSY